MTSGADRRRSRRSFGAVPALVAALALAVIAVYGPVRLHDFVDMDDDLMVTENPRVMSGLTLQNVRWSLTTLECANWQPVTWWSHMLDVSLFGRRAAGHHLVSVALHALNASLLFILLRAMTGSVGAPLIAAALFGLHPLRVESVAWVAERKDVLSTAFWLLSTLAYVRWCRRPSVPRYAAVALLLAFGLMAKPMLVTLPCTLLLLDFWPLGRSRGPGSRSWGRLVVEKTPLLALAGAAAVVTVIAQQSAGAVASLTAIPIVERIGNALSAYGWYLAKTAWPSGLAIPVEMAARELPAWTILLAAALLLGGTAAAVLFARRRPYVPVGWLWFLGTLVPVIGFVQVGSQLVADRYTYVPSIGIALIVGWVAAEIAPAPRRRLPAVFIGLAAALALAAVTRQQLRHWKDTDALFSRTLSLYPLSFMAHNNLGVRAAAGGRWETAAEHFRWATLARPDSGFAHFNLANALENLGRGEEAVLEYQQAVLNAMAPERLARAHLRLARLLDGFGRPEEVREHLERAVALSPRDNAAAFDLGTVHLLQGRNEEAAEMLSRVVSDSPENVDARANLGYALMRLGRTEEAVREFEAAARLRPADAGIRQEYGQALRRAGREKDALAEFREAERLQPGRQPAPDSP